jgi:hypothetical protein
MISPTNSWTTRSGRPTTTRPSSTNTYGTATRGVPVKFKQLHNFSFNILPKSMKGRRRDTKEIMTTTSSTCSTHSGNGCLLLTTIARTNPSSAEPQLSDPPGFFFSAMPAKRTLRRSASGESLGAAFARRTKAQLAAGAANSGEIRPDRSMGDAKTTEERSRIRPVPGPSGGCGGHAKLKA